MNKVVVLIIFSGLVLSLPLLTKDFSRPFESDGGKAAIFVPGLDQKGKGVIGKFEVEAMPGDGKILTNINHLLYFVDTQYSMQTARSVAGNVTGADMTKFNLVYDIDTDSDKSQLIEGPSAGAAMTIATIAAIQNVSLSGDVMITGSIEPDGTIGKIGGIEAKAKAAKAGGAKVFLVPYGQGISDSYRVESGCRDESGYRICGTEYVRQPSVGSSGGIVIREVGNITDALKYFIPQ